MNYLHFLKLFLFLQPFVASDIGSQSTKLRPLLISLFLV